MTRFDDFLLFSHAQLRSLDVDPLYPILSYLERDMDPEQALWHTLLYVGYYTIASSIYAFSLTRSPSLLPSQCIKLATGTERRNFRNGSINRHIASICTLRQKYGSLYAWLTCGFGEDRKENWHLVQENIQMPWGNGRWAAYKTGEILYKVHNFPLIPTDMGNAFSSGPREGLSLFYEGVAGNSVGDIGILDAQGENMLTRMYDAGVPMGIEQLETMLCDFHALVAGRYYVGHDIDQMQEQLLKSRLSKEALASLWGARMAVLPHAYLGELHTWSGVERERKKVYRQEGKVLLRG